MSRYFIYNYSISSTILIDTIDKTITIYQTNIYGQFYNLKTAEPKVISNAKISGLIKRLNGNYSYETAYVTDEYIYKHLMTTEQQERCTSTPYKNSENDFIYSGNNLNECLYNMCIAMYDKENRTKTEEFDGKTRTEMLNYCKELIA